MQQATVVTYGVDSVLVQRLRELAQGRRFRLRETSQLAACQSLVYGSAPSVLVLMLGRDLERELALLELVHATLPKTASIVIGDTDNPVLAGLAWDLGASYVLFPPTPTEWLGEVVGRILAEATP